MSNKKKWERFIRRTLREGRRAVLAVSLKDITPQGMSVEKLPDGTYRRKA